MKYILVCIILLPLLSAAQQLTKTELADSRAMIKSALSDKNNKQILVDKVISDKETAIAVAEPILFKIYGKNQILSEKPYQVELVDGYWILNGTLPKGYLGGTFLIILSAKDGRVIKLTHYK
jgi:septin family protein